MGNSGDLKIVDASNVERCEHKDHLGYCSLEVNMGIPCIKVKRGNCRFNPVGVAEKKETAMLKIEFNPARMNLPRIMEHLKQLPIDVTAT